VILFVGVVPSYIDSVLCVDKDGRVSKGVVGRGEEVVERGVIKKATTTNLKDGDCALSQVR
jgi:hypothetical protein